jgi:uncharacterized protein YbjT (DUF2867 family)/ligand-binding SRPBCC domain-containing protein
MPTHTLLASQLIPRPLDDVFAFFSRPENLGRITPPWMEFEIVSPDRDMRTGLVIDYTLHAFPGVPSRWRAGIAEYLPPHTFTDVQIDGPYRRWEHQHRFAQVGEGTRVDDRIEFELPLGRLGGLASGLVEAQLEQIFTYRARAVEAIFEPAGTAAPGLAPRVVAVAGGTGFVGGAIARELRRRGHDVVVLSSQGEGSRGLLPDDVEIRAVDVTTGRGLPESLEGVDALVVALAFRNSPIEQPRRGQTFAAVDAGGTERLVAAARRQRLGAVLYISGAGAAPDADRHWFRAKWRAEEAIRSSGLRWTILRPTWIYGPRDVSLNRFVGFARRLPAVPLTNRGRQRLAPVFVDDVAAAAADLLVRPAGADATFEIGGPEVLEMREIVRRASDQAGLHKPIVPGPAPLLKIGVAPLTLLPNPPLTPDAIDFINQPAVVDSAPLRAALGREMRGLDEALATYLGRLPNGATLAID